MPQKTKRAAPRAVPATTTPSPATTVLACAVTAVVAGAIGCAIGSHTGRSAAQPPTALPHQTGVLERVVANYYFDQKDWPDAIAYYKLALAHGQDNPDTHTDLGSAYRFANQPKQAIAQYLMAQKQDPHHENSLFNLGGVYAFGLNDAPDAIRIWQDYLARFPHGTHESDAKILIADLAQQAHGGVLQSPKPAK